MLFHFANWWLALFTAGGVSAQGPSGTVHDLFNAAVCGSARFGDAASRGINPAGLALAKGWGVAVSGEKRYLLRELSSGRASLVLPAAGGALGITAAYSGFADFHQSDFRICYGRSLGKGLQLGTGLHYRTMHVAGYGNAAAPGFEVGLLAQATPGLSCSVQVVDPLGAPFLHNPQEKLPAIYSLAFLYEPSGHLMLRVETSKTSGSPADIRTSIHYQFADEFFVRAVWCTAPGGLMAGVGLNWNGWRLDFMAGYRGLLGITPALQVVTGAQKRHYEKAPAPLPAGL